MYVGHDEYMCGTRLMYVHIPDRNGYYGVHLVYVGHELCMWDMTHVYGIRLMYVHIFYRKGYYGIRLVYVCGT